MKKIFSSVICIIISLSLILCASVPSAAFSFGISPRPFTSAAKKRLAPGITEEHIVTYRSGDTGRNDNYVATIDFSNEKVGMLAGYRNYDSSGKWGLQSVKNQAKAAENATGKRIVAAVNGDFFLSSGEPVNTLIMNGKTVKASTEKYYFAILKDGTPVIRKATESTKDVLEAVGTNNLLLKDGEIKTPKNGKEVAPRTAVGITEDGCVKVLVTDGRNSPQSVGATLYETAQLMLSLGCVDALNLDGGGSSTFCTRGRGDDEIEVKNNPSDGSPRAVSSTLLFYSTAEPGLDFSFLDSIVQFFAGIIDFIANLFRKG